LIFQSGTNRTDTTGTKRTVMVLLDFGGGTNRTDISGTIWTVMVFNAAKKWHKSNRNAWH